MQIDTVLVKVASRCNINCTYCYIYNMGDEGWRDMPNLISKATIKDLARSLAQLIKDQVSQFATVLHGGEPLMLGARRLQYLLTELRSVLPLEYPISLQTNGILITDEILDLCALHRVSVSVSIDGPQAINDKFRVDKQGRGTYQKVVDGITLLKNHSDSEFLYAGLLSVIDPSSDPEAVYNCLKRLGTKSIDFLYRDGNHTSLPYGKDSLISTEYGEWLAKLLDIYIADREPVKIRFLDDILRIALGGFGVKEGLGDNFYGIAIIETDGSLSKNDTLKSNFDGADKFDEKWMIKTDRLSEAFNTSSFEEYYKLQRPTSSECNSCKYLTICGGGMPLHRWSRENAYDNPSVYCSDQKLLISKAISILNKEGMLR